MIVLAELPDGRGIIGYDPAVLIVTVNVRFVLLRRFPSIAGDKKKDLAVFICRRRDADLGILIELDIGLWILFASLDRPWRDLESLEADIKESRIQLHIT